MTKAALAAFPSEAIAAAVASVGAGPCAVFDAAHEVVWANPAAAALIEAFGKPAFGAPADRRGAMATGRTARRQIEVGPPDRRRTFTARFTAIAGEPDFVLCALSDVTSEARAMKTLREVTLRANEFISLVSDCIWETGPDWRISHFALRDADTPATRALIGRNLFEVGSFDKPERGGPRPPSPRHRAIFHAAPFRASLKGVERVLLLTGMPLFDPDGAFLGYRGAGDDVTARFAAEGAMQEARSSLLMTLDHLSDRNRELDQALAAAQAANASKDDFLARMSHELRTPLNAVLGLSSILRVGATDRLEPKQRQFLDEIHNAGRHLLALVEDVLEYSRSRAGEMRMRREAVDLGEIAREAIAFLRVAAEERGVTVREDIGPELAMSGDTTRLRQVFINLLSNAVKFSPTGGTIFVAVGREGDDLRASVRDEGPGVPPALAERVFDPFFQAEEGASRSHGGLGLGLALCRQFVTWHGGRISLTGAPQGGAIACFSLPAATGRGDAAV